jgi:hypothetical protein
MSLISLKNKGGYTDIWIDTDRQQGDLISHLSYFLKYGKQDINSR